MRKLLGFSQSERVIISAIVMLAALFAPGAKLEAAVPAPPPTSPPHAVILVDHHDVQVAGIVTERWSRKVQVFDENGINEFADATFIYDSEKEDIKIIKAQTTTSQGEVHPCPEGAINRTLVAELADFPDFARFRLLTISFLAVDSGAILEFEVERPTAKDFYPWMVRKWYLVDDVEVKKSNYAVTTQHEVIRLNQFGISLGNCFSSFDEHEDWPIPWDCFYNDLQPLVREGNPERYRASQPTLYVSTCPSWDVMVQDLLNRCQSSASDVPGLNVKTEALIADALNPADKLGAIYGYCREAIKGIELPLRYFGYAVRPSAQVWQTMYGNQLERALLLTAMVKHAGGDCALVFVAPTERNPEKIPGFDFFEALLVEVSFSGEKWLVDLNAGPEKWGAGHLFNKTVLKVPLTAGPDVTPFSWEHIGPSDPEQNQAKLTLRLTAKDDDSVTGTAYFEWRGWFSEFYAMRKGTNAFLEKTLGDMVEKPQFEKMDVIFNSPERAAVQVSFTGKLKSTELGQGYVLYELPAAGALAKTAPEVLPGKRVTAFDLECAFTETTDVELTYPETWEVRKLPEKVKQSFSFGAIDSGTTPAEVAKLETKAEKNAAIKKAEASAKKAAAAAETKTEEVEPASGTAGKKGEEAASKAESPVEDEAAGGNKISWKRRVQVTASIIPAEDYGSFIKFNELVKKPELHGVVFKTEK